MSKQVPFIGREEELTLVENLIREWGRHRIVLVQGEGGIGKTRLLQEVQTRFAAEEPYPVLIPEVIDFGRPEIRTADGLGMAISDAIGRRAFTDYLHRLSDWREMQQVSVTPERLEEERQSVIRSFAECFNAISSKRRVVLLIDTVDTVNEQDAANIGYVSRLDNVLVLLAGRQVQGLSEMLPSDLSDDVRSIPLSPFQPEDSKRYLIKKQELLHTTLEKNLAAKLLLLAEGRPIIIDLAVEWIAREAPVDWLVEESLDELQALSEKELAKRCCDFEYHLVRSIANRRSPLDQLFLVLSKIDSLDVGGVAQMLRLPTEDAKALWNEAQESSVVKLCAGQRIALHDEMRRMVNGYVWPEIDPTGARLRRDSRRAVDYLAGRMAELESRLGEIRRTGSEAGTLEELETLWQREALEREFWTVARQHLRFTTVVDPFEGVALFARRFDGAVHQARQVRQGLIEEVEQYVGRLPFEQRYEFDIRKARQLNDQGDYLSGKALLLDLLRVEKLEPKQQVETLLQLGNAEIRLGYFVAGISWFGQASNISQQYRLIDYSIEAEIAWGWGCRLIGQLDQALAHYRDALKRAFETDNQQSQAQLLNSLGYTYALRRNRSAALQLCHQALGIWEELDCERNVGFAFGTIATVLSEFGQFDEALECRQRAIDIFEPAEDWERLSSNYYLRGVAYWLMGDLESAQNDLEKAQGIGIQYEQHIILYYLAQVSRNREDIDKALALFEESRRLSQSLPDPLYELSNLGGMVKIAVDQHQFSTWRKYENEAELFKSTWSMAEYKLQEGLLWKCLGDLALGDTQFDKAVQFYQQGLPLIAEAGTYEPYTISTQLGETEHLFHEQPTYLHDLGEALMQFWLEKGLDQEHPEVLFFFARWKHQEQLETA